MDPISVNIQGVQQLVGSKMNKSLSGATNSADVEGPFEDEFTLKLDDEELLHLEKQWIAQYAGYEAKIKPRQMANKTYYLGRQKEGSPNATTDGQPISANLIFEAEETFIPAALSKNPEPVVWSDNSKEGEQISNDVKTMLQFHADRLVLRRKLGLMTRNWSVDFLAVMKHGWDAEINDITSEVRDVKNFMFDVDGYVDPYGDFVGYLGERITITAQALIDIFPEHKSFITVAVDGKLGTSVTYTQWWNDDYYFYTFKGKVLEKAKNPHFNYPQQVEGIDPEGQPTTQENPGKNHFARPKKPYTFLSVFSFGDQPHDATGMIEQNIPNQRRVTRRTEQIDYNLSKANNSDVFSENNFTQQTAKQAATAMAKGHPVLIPSGGPIGEAVHRLEAPQLGAAFFNELENSKNDLRSIFGTEGLTAQPIQKDELATNLVMNQQHDSSRIGGGIGDALEQVADNVFNWWTQLYHVYYDVAHFAIIMGQMKAVEYVTLSSSSFGSTKLVISVSPDSMKPKDEVSQMNQAMQLYEAGALDIKSLLVMLNFPDPQNTAAQAWLWKTNPQLYGELNFPDVAAQIQQLMMAQQPQGAPPGQPGQAPPGAPVAAPAPNPTTP